MNKILFKQCQEHLKMMNKGIIRQLIGYVAFILLQVLVFKNIALFDVSFCFVYVAILLLLPVETDRILTMIIAFITGLLIDVFYNSLGIHASAMVLIAFIRNYWLSVITPQGGFDGNISPSAINMGGQWFSTYAIPLIFVHHLTMFFTEAGGFHLFGFTFLKVLSSTFFTFIVVVIVQFLLTKKKRQI